MSGENYFDSTIMPDEIDDIFDQEINLFNTADTMNEFDSANHINSKNSYNTIVVIAIVILAVTCKFSKTLTRVLYRFSRKIMGRNRNHHTVTTREHNV